MRNLYIILLFTVPLALDSYRDVSFDHDSDALAIPDDQVRIHEEHNVAASEVTSISTPTVASETLNAKENELESTEGATSEQDAVQVAESSVLGEVEGAGQSYTITVQPGALGVKYNEGTGHIFVISKGSQAEQAGIQAGDIIIGVNGSPFSDGAWHRAKMKNKPYAMVLWRQSMAEFLAKWLQCLSDTAICAYVICRLGYDALFASGMQGGNTVLTCMASAPVLLLVVSSVCAQIIHLCAAMMNHNVLPALYLSVCTVFTCSQAVGARGLRDSPLAQPTQSDITRTHAAERLFSGISLVYWIIGAGSVAKSVIISNAQLSQVLLASCFGETGEPKELSQWFFLYGLVWGYSRVAEACSARLRQVSDVLPCDAEVFDEKARKPVVQLVNDLCPVLAGIGMPLLFMCAGLVRDSFVLLSLGMRIQNGYCLSINVITAARVGCSIALTAIVLTTAPFGISSELDEVKSKLAEARTHDSSLHFHIHAVETMLAQANRGQGFGIPAGQTCVLTKSFFQTATLRLAAAATILMTVAKTLLGYEHAERLAMDDLLAKTDLLLAAMNESHNMSSLR